MNIADLRTELKYRLALDVNDDFGIKESWKRLTRILSENADETIDFFTNRCSVEEFFWLSEVFSDVSTILQSKELIIALRNRLSQITCEEVKNEMGDWGNYDEYVESISTEIDYAEAALSDV
jgi:hypothetical protein